MKKRLLALLLVLAMCLCLLPVSVFAAYQIPVINVTCLSPKAGSKPSTAGKTVGGSPYVSWPSLHVKHDEHDSVPTVWTYTDSEGNTQTLAATENFQADTVYTVTITLEAMSGYEFEDPDAITFEGKPAEFAEKTKTRVVIKHTFPATAPRQSIEKLKFAGKEPVFGASPDGTVSIPMGPAGVESLKWTDSKGNVLTASDVFADQTYTLTLTCRAFEYAKFDKTLTAQMCFLNPEYEYLDIGKQASALRVLSETQAEVEFTWTVPAPVKTLKLAATPQGYGETPILYARPEPDAKGFTVRATRWHDETAGKDLTSSDKLVKGHVYRMEMDVYPAKGYVFDTSINATLNGAPVSSVIVNAEYVTVIAKAPVGDAKPIHTVEFTYRGILAGGQPAEESVDWAEDAPYDGSTVLWYDKDGNELYNFTFQDEQEYTMVIVASANPGHVFAEDVEFLVDGKPVSAKITDDRNAEITVPVVIEGEYTLSFDANGGFKTMEPVKIPKGAKVTLPKCAFTPPDGKRFDRWDLGKPGDQVTLSEDTTLRAIWVDAANPFTDVKADDYFYYAVIWAYYHDPQITTGTTTTTFEPGATVLRGQAVTFLWRAAGCPTPAGYGEKFSDVDYSESSWYGDAVQWAVEEGITVGTGDGKFSPWEPVYRDQMITFLWRTLGKPGGETGVPYWFSDAEKWATENDLLTGTDPAYQHDAQCPRADVVYYIWKALAK